MADKPEIQSPSAPMATGAPPTIGRTPWDFASEAIRSRAAILIVAAVFLVMPLAIHFLAEPSSEVNLFLGLIKYKKAARTPEPPKPEPKENPLEPIPSSYFLPEKEQVKMDAVTPILDGTLNVIVVNNRTGPNFVRIGGANLYKIRAGARLLNGNPIELTPNLTTKTLEIPGETDCLVEIEYLQHVFALSVRASGSYQYELSIRPAPKATLELRAYSLK